MALQVQRVEAARRRHSLIKGHSLGGGRPGVQVLGPDPAGEREQAEEYDNQGAGRIPHGGAEGAGEVVGVGLLAGVGQQCLQFPLL